MRIIVQHGQIVAHPTCSSVELNAQTPGTAEIGAEDKKRRFRDVSHSVVYYAFGKMIYTNKYKCKSKKTKKARIFDTITG